MDNEIIEKRLKQYAPKSPEEEENAYKEVLQELALYALSTTDFFAHASFQGGTALRILYQLPRFSEDLDFILNKSNKNFSWEKYIHQVNNAFELFDIHPEIIDRSKADQSIKKLFLKDNSIGKIIKLTFPAHSQKKFLIKFEIDTNPPSGSTSEIKFLEFPLDYSITSQDLSSNFSGKCHALLCRAYMKGRDWFDFSWYVANKISPNFKFLESAILQQGPWQNQKIQVTKKWLTDELANKIKSIDWTSAKAEVERFANGPDRDSLRLWNADFFMDKVNKLTHYLS